MPNSNEKPLEGALFSMDENGQRQDARLHGEILNAGDHVAAQAVGMAVMRRAGLSPKAIASLMPWVLDKKLLDEIRAKRAKPDLAALEKQTSMLSSPGMIRKTPAYQTFVKLGERTLPLLRNALQTGSVAAMPVMLLLEEITGEQPYDDADRGDQEKMHTAWLNWFARK